MDQEEFYNTYIDDQKICARLRELIPAARDGQEVGGRKDARLGVSFITRSIG